MSITTTRKILCLLLLAMASPTGATAQGIITTIAGNGITQYIGDGWPATFYSLAAPGGICVDKYGNIFEADWAISRIRQVDKQDTLSTYAGTGTPGSEWRQIHRAMFMFSKSTIM